MVRLGEPVWGWSILQTRRAMENTVDENVAESLGISNVHVDQLAALLSCVRIRLTFVQNRCFAAARWDERGSHAMSCRKHRVSRIFVDFGKPEFPANASSFRKSPSANGKTAEQVIYRFAIQLGIVPLTGTTNGIPHA